MKNKIVFVLFMLILISCKEKTEQKAEKVNKLEEINLNSTEPQQYYQFAILCFQNINRKLYENIKFDNRVPKSISILIDHDFIPIL